MIVCLSDRELVKDGTRFHIIGCSILLDARKVNTCVHQINVSDESRTFSGSGCGFEKWKLIGAAPIEDGDDVVGLLKRKAVSLFFLSWNFAAHELSRWIFRWDFVLGFGCRSPALGLKWSSLGRPKNGEKFTKAWPFTDSMISLDCLPDDQHFTNLRRTCKEEGPFWVSVSVKISSHFL